MQILFVGLGSIAKRHIKNIKEIDNSIRIDVLRHGKNTSLNNDIVEPVRKCYFTIDDIQDVYDAIFITNPTSKHYETLKALGDFSSNFFIEKPVFETGDENLEELCLRKEGHYYVACPLRYSNVIEYLKQNVDFNNVYSIRVISSSYLPDWRPGIDYKQTYSAHKELGGGVSIDLIHEWDYLFYLLGSPKSVKSIISKKSNLEIDSDDIAIYVAEYDGLLAEVHLDYFGRKTIRKAEIFTKDDSIEVDLIKQSIFYRKSNKMIDLSEDRDSYQKKELMHFFDIISEKCNNDNSIEEACQVLQITRGKEGIL